MSRTAVGGVLVVLFAPAAIGLEAPTQAPSRAGSERMVMDSTLGATTGRGSSADLTLLLSPLGAHYESGPRIRFSASASRYRYWTDADRTGSGSGLDRALDVLVGYGVAVDRGFLLATVGPTFLWSDQRSSPGGPTIASQRSGALMVLSYYGVPTDNTMIYAQGRYSTISSAYFAEARGGIQVSPELYVGPEVSVSGGTGYGQWRVGAHLSGLQLGPLRLGVGAGFLEDRNTGSGGYISTRLLIPF
jgi:hypothetical protein